MDIYPPAVQRPALLSFASALSSASTALRRDECGDWRILGAAGHVYAIPGGFLIIAATGTARGWSAVKRRLDFTTLQRDGDDGGAFILDRLPSAAEAVEIRQALGIRKRAAYSAEQLTAMSTRFPPLALGVAGQTVMQGRNLDLQSGDLSRLRGVRRPSPCPSMLPQHDGAPIPLAHR